MADNLNIYRACGHCKGTGKVPAYELPTVPPATTTECPMCNGTGEVLWGFMREEEIE